MKAALACLAILAVIGLAMPERESSATGSRPVPVPSSVCLVTGTGARLCDDDAIAWCEAVSTQAIVGTMDDSHIVRVVPERSRRACESVGWVG